MTLTLFTRSLGLLTLAAAVALSGCGDPGARAAAPAAARFALGYRTSGADDAPIERAQQAVRRQPSAEAYLDLATAFIQRQRRGRDPQFLIYAEDALAAARQAGGDALPGVAVADIYLLTEQHRFIEARDAAARLIATRPDDADGHLLLGDALLELGDYDGAADAYQRAADRRPDLRTYERAAHIRWLDGDIDGAAELLGFALEAASRRDPEPAAWCHVALGTMAWQRGDLPAAAAAVERALALVAAYPPALLLDARVRFGRGDLAGALARLDAIPNRLRTLEELSLRGDLLDGLGRGADAARISELVAQRGRTDPREAARYWARRGVEPARAVELASTATQSRPTIDALAVEAIALARAGRPGDARASLARARRLGTPDPRLPLYSALIELADRKPAAARAALAEALPAARAVDPVLVAQLERHLEAQP